MCFKCIEVCLCSIAISHRSLCCFKKLHFFGWKKIFLFQEFAVPVFFFFWGEGCFFRFAVGVVLVYIYRYVCICVYIYNFPFLNRFI